MTLRYSGAPSGQDAIKRFPRVNPGLCFHGPSGRRHRAKHIRSAGSTVFAGILRSILSSATKAAFLLNLNCPGILTAGLPAPIEAAILSIIAARLRIGQVRVPQVVDLRLIRSMCFARCLRPEGP